MENTIKTQILDWCYDIRCYAEQTAYEKEIKSLTKKIKYLLEEDTDEMYKSLLYPGCEKCVNYDVNCTPISCTQSTDCANFIRDDEGCTK